MWPIDNGDGGGDGDSDNNYYTHRGGGDDVDNDDGDENKQKWRWYPDLVISSTKVLLQLKLFLPLFWLCVKHMVFILYSYF